MLYLLVENILKVSMVLLGMKYEEFKQQTQYNGGSTLCFISQD